MNSSWKICRSNDYSNIKYVLAIREKQVYNYITICADRINM